MSDILKKALAKQARDRETQTLSPQPAALQQTEAPQKVAPAFTAQPPVRRESSPKPQAAPTTKKENFNPQSLDEFKIVYDCRIHPAADQVKILRTQMLRKLQKFGGKSVLITSPGPGDGKTINAINVAISIAQEIDRTVLLIDANLRTPAIHKFFGIKQGLGLADYLLGKATIPELLVNPGIDKLTLLPSGRPLATSSEMLGASRMADLVNEMKSRYEDRILVFDGPDILTNADALVFSSLVDGIVLVVEAEKTTRQEIKDALGRLHNANLIGTIFNKARE
ncbi:MAG TPA: polysaccharide biosynthesis tyrosine autokinase [Proteobacteria bacterium]|nr:polysaccharide biosynthesis tyrosine autokinase [Pseudomonadota bacterium]